MQISPFPRRCRVHSCTLGNVNRGVHPEAVSTELLPVPSACWTRQVAGAIRDRSSQAIRLGLGLGLG
jgi:hypothetical protein